ncbi:TonB C-terminal domain-containing protein [Niveibacterium sp. SC-1]|uniref:TonB C-terminal domain-containing protein n=1 Tax=Niveibacterium sp. SC-1 TaxID=3135646 RepID=UPI00311FDEFE
MSTSRLLLPGLLLALTLSGCSLLAPDTPTTGPASPQSAPQASSSAPVAATSQPVRDIETSSLAPQRPLSLADTQTLMRDYVIAIQVKIRSKLVVPKGLKGNPEAVFKVEQDRQGRILGKPVMSRSSGNKSLDAAIGKAILAASPLPPPPRADLYYRSLELAVRPRR